MTKAEWDICENPAVMLEFLRRRASSRKLRLFACACCRRIPKWMGDERSRVAVEACERYADGLAFNVELSRALNRAVGTVGGWVTSRLAPRHVEEVRTAVAKWAPDGLAERKYQCALLRCIFGNHFAGGTVLSPALKTWQDATIPKLAQAAYDQRALPAGTLDNARLAVLADALEEAGCDNKEVLSHLREQGKVHVRGCFALDCLLEKK